MPTCGSAEDNLKSKDGVLVAVNTVPTRADPALRFVGWGSPFAHHLVGGGRKMAGPLTISGLPASALPGRPQIRSFYATGPCGRPSYIMAADGGPKLPSR